MRSLTPVFALLACLPALAEEAPASWEGAVGLVSHRSPNYMGGAGAQWHLIPGIYLRYGRFTVTTAGGFVTRRNDEVERGLAAELVGRDDLRVSLSGRTDGGRDAGSDPALNGLPDVRPTLRARLSAVKRLPGGFRVSAGVNPDLLGRGGGITADAGISHDWQLSPTLVTSLGVGGTWANQTYMQSYFGITPAQSVSSGHAAYRPSSGLRDVGWGANLRADLGPRWIGFAGMGMTRLAGPTVASPLTTGRSSWSVNGGLAWRF